MPTPFESAQLNLKLFEMRRESELRKARNWYLLEFHPTTVEEYFAGIMSDKNSWARMTVGYWDMAASMVVHGAIDRDMFLAAHGEIIGTYSKAQPFIHEIRARFGPLMLANVEKVVMSMPDAEAELEKRRARLRGLWESRGSSPAGFKI
jgi:hypothetical protein